MEELKIVRCVCGTVVFALCIALGGCYLEQRQELEMANKGYVWVPDARAGSYQKK